MAVAGLAGQQVAALLIMALLLVALLVAHFR
jgi:hypothetical protein